MDTIETIIVSVLILIVGVGSIASCIRCARGYGIFSHYFQLFVTISALLLAILFVDVAFGEKAMNSLFTGVMIGLGLALQPLIKVIVHGFIFDGTQIQKTTREVEIKGIRGRIKTIGMLHTWIEDREGNLFMVSNTTINENPLKVYSLNKF
jgi:hypothetical protein